MPQFDTNSSDTVSLGRRFSYLLYSKSGTPASGTRSAGSRSVLESRTGSYGLDWRKEIRLHRNAATFLHGTKQTYNGGYGQHSAKFYAYSNGKYVDQYETETGRLIWVSFPTPASTSASVDNLAKTRLLRDAASKMTAFRSLTALGELRETLRMIRNPAKALRQRVVQHVKSVTKRARRIRTPSKRRSYIRDTYLELTFGVQPLVNDVHSAGDALNRRLERFASSYARVSGKAKEFSESFAPMVSYNQGGLVVQRRWGARTVRSHSKWYRGEVVSVCPNPVQADMRLLGVSWADVALTGWELVPYSFVVDYFTNIGDILESWTLRQSDWRWLFSTDKLFARTTSTNVILEDWAITSNPRYRAEKGYTRSFSCSPARATVSTVWRATPLSAPTIGFQWEVPGMGSRKWLNLAALSKTLKSGERQVTFRR